LKLKFHACSLKQAFYPFHKQNNARNWQHEILQVFCWVPCYQTCMWKRSIKLNVIDWIIGSS